MAFVRHVGKHGDRKVAIVFREIPGETHMALVVYTETLNRSIHDPLVQCIESDIGQSSDDLATALNRTYTTDGQVILQKLHAEGMLKKVNTEQIVVTPAPNTRIKLSELNSILDEMKLGEEAVKRLAELDSQMGMQDPAAVARRMRGENKDAYTPETIPETKRLPPEAPLIAPQSGLLGDDTIAFNLRQQAERMQREAEGLVSEARRLMEQANEMAPIKAPKVAKVTVTPDSEKKTRGRPKKSDSVAQ